MILDLLLPRDDNMGSYQQRGNVFLVHAKSSHNHKVNMQRYPIKILHGLASKYRFVELVSIKNGSQEKYSL